MTKLTEHKCPNCGKIFYCDRWSGKCIKPEYEAETCFCDKCIPEPKCEVRRGFIFR